jgi:iron complex outermembrane receptor protein
MRMGGFHARRALCALLVLRAFDAAAQVPDANTSAESDGKAANTSAANMGDVVVTGSYVKEGGFTLPSPVQVLDRAAVEKFGAAQFVDVLRAIPSNTGSELYNEATNRAGTAQFNLRGLGFSSTLTLINGRRAGFAPVSDRTGGDFVDINQFPLSMIERVDVLKDGASAIYGSDAVAGVVNIATRRGFEGFEVSAQYADATNQNTALSFATGNKFDRGSFNLYGTYYTQTGNDRTDFDWLVERIGGNGVLGRSQLLSSTADPGTYRRATPATGGNFTRLPNAVPFADPDCEAAGGVFRIRDDGSTDRSSCLYDFADQVSIIPDTNRLQTFAEFDYALADGVKFTGEASFSHNVAKSTKGPGAFQNGSVVGSGAGDVLIPANHPFNFFVQDPNNPRGLVYIGPDAWNPAVDVAVPVTASIRPFGTELNGDAAPKRRSETDYARAVSNIEVSLPHDWDGSLSYTYSQATFSETEPLEYNADILNNLISTGRFNPFGTAETRPDLISPKDGVSTAGNDAQILRQIQTTDVRQSRTTQDVVEAIVRGAVPSFLAEDIGIAAGAQYRRNKLNDTPDSLTAAGEARGSNFETPISGSQDVSAEFLETAFSFADLAKVQLAVRHEDYGGGIGASTDPKVAARLQATQQLAVRASWSTSFQAPTLRQTSSAISREFLNDPVSLTPQGLVCRSSGITTNALVNVVGDDNLKPQSSRNYNLGLVFEPLRAARFSVDYWRYRYTDLIAPGAGGQALVNNDCADDGVPNDPRITRAGDGTVLQIDTSFINVGQVVAAGFDLSGVYTLPMEHVGDFEFSLDATDVSQFDVTGADGKSFSGLGSRNFSNNFAPIPRWRAQGRVSWSRGAHQLSLTGRFIDGFKNDQSNNAEVSSMTTADVQYQLNLKELLDSNTQIILGADNVFDEDPPSLVRKDVNGNRIGGTLTDVDRPGYEALAGHDIRGRVAYVRFVHQF